MTRYRIAVCDDEPSELEDIVQSVKRYDAMATLTLKITQTVQVLLSDLLLKKKSFDLLLLDIRNAFKRIPDGANLTQMEKHPLVIFVNKAA